MPICTPLQEISKLQEQISKLKDAAATELQARRIQIHTELKNINAQLESLTGKPAGRRSTPATRSVTLKELKDLLMEAPNHTLNIRKAGLDTTNIKTLANLYPKEIELGSKGAWPTVGLVR